MQVVFLDAGIHLYILVEPKKNRVWTYIEANGTIDIFKMDQDNRDTGNCPITNYQHIPPGPANPVWAIPHTLPVIAINLPFSLTPNCLNVLATSQ